MVWYPHHKIPSLDPVLSKMNPAYVLTSHFFKMHFNIRYILASTPRSLGWLLFFRLIISSTLTSQIHRTRRIFLNQLRELHLFWYQWACQVTLCTGHVTTRAGARISKHPTGRCTQCEIRDYVMEFPRRQWYVKVTKFRCIRLHLFTCCNILLMWYGILSLKVVWIRVNCPWSWWTVLRNGSLICIVHLASSKIERVDYTRLQTPIPCSCSAQSCDG